MVISYYMRIRMWFYSQLNIVSMSSALLTGYPQNVGNGADSGVSSFIP